MEWVKSSLVKLSLQSRVCCVSPHLETPLVFSWCPWRRGGRNKQMFPGGVGFWLQLVWGEAEGRRC